MSSVRQLLTLKQKVEIEEQYEKDKNSVRDLAKRFNISKTQAANIIKKRSELKDKWYRGVNQNQKRLSLKGHSHTLDEKVYEWFGKIRSKGIPISGPILKNKAREIAEKIGYVNFQASDGWLQRFRHRHDITFKSISGEAASVNMDDVKNFKERLSSILLGYRPEDVYNADESGLFYKALPDKTLALKKEKCVGGKMAKERLTILFCANITRITYKCYFF